MTLHYYKPIAQFGRPSKELDHTMPELDFFHCHFPIKSKHSHFNGTFLLFVMHQQFTCCPNRQYRGHICMLAGMQLAPLCN